MNGIWYKCLLRVSGAPLVPMNSLLPTPPLVAAEALLAACAGAEPPVLVDCRFRLDDPRAGAEAWRTSRLPGARYGDLEQDFSGPVIPGRSGRHPLPDLPHLRARFRAWGIGATTPVVFYDDAGGPFAARAWWLACHAGHPHAQVLDGGIAAWTDAGGELETTPPAPPGPAAPPWPERPPLLEAITVAEVGELLGSGAPLVDARTVERFAGEAEPIDPVAGHIPGAVCLPHGSNLGPDGRWLAPEVLAARWAGIDADAAVCYCGSGVTAAHNVLAAVHAGVGRPRLFVGSWSEWIRDPERPIATGRA